MSHRPFLAAAAPVAAAAALFAALSSGRLTAEAPTAPAGPPRLLPGALPDGFVQLPNQWRLRPAGRQLELGDFPVNLALHPSGQYLAALHAGFKDHEVVVIDLNPARQKVVSRLTVDQAFYGLCFSPDGRRVYASGGEFEVVHEFAFDRGVLSNPRPISVAADVPKQVVGGVAVSADGRDLFAACPWGDVVVRVAVDNPDNRVVIPMTPKPARADAPKGEPPSPPDG